MIVPARTTGENITGAIAAGAGWIFNGTTTATGIGGLPSTRTTTANGTGTVNFPLTFPGGTTTAPVTIRETQQTGYTLVTRGLRTRSVRICWTAAQSASPTTR